MRVLDPKVKHPIYKLHDKATQAIGDGGVLTAIAGAGIAAPVAAGIMIDTPFGLLSAIGWYGVITFRGYLKNTKNKTRVNILIQIRRALPEDYQQLIDPLVTEVYHCPNNHFDYQTTDQKGKYYEHDDKGGRSFTMKYLDRETEAQWQIRKAKEKILKAGYGCDYCGERIVTAQELKTECEQRWVDDDNSLQIVRDALEAKRVANESMREFLSIKNTSLKELA